VKSSCNLVETWYNRFWSRLAVDKNYVGLQVGFIERTKERYWYTLGYK